MTRIPTGLRWIVPLALAVILISGAALAGDVLRPAGGGNLDVGALVDGMRAGSVVNDAVYTDVDLRGFFGALFPRVLLANFSAAPESNEIIVFSRGHVPQLVTDIPWSSGFNAVDVELKPSLEIPITIWAVAGPFAETQASAEEAALTTSMIWQKDRQGLRFSEVEIVDATANPAAPSLQNLTCGEANAFKSLIGFRENRINIYYVDNVDLGVGPSSFSGVWCGVFGIIGMARDTSDALLAHELGHGLGLAHTQQYTAFFDTTNVMHNASPNRRFLTEGQTFRSIYLPNSSLNGIYDVREGQAVRSCPPSIFVFDLDCPAIQKRAWSDGTNWPSN